MYGGMDDDDEYEIPLRDQRYFGAGIKRKRIHFVPSSDPNINGPSTSTKSSTQSAADRYLAIVLGKDPTKEAKSKSTEDRTDPSDTACPLCRRPIATGDDKAKHESTIAHQICLEHSHPPSSVDRQRKGLAVLLTHGWDPDARKGLGALGEGVLHPVKAKENPNRAGLGADPSKPQPKPRPTKLDAGQVKALHEKGKKKAHDLRNAFYRSDDVERYLGHDQRNSTLDFQAFKRSKKK